MAAPRPLPGCRALDPLASALPSSAPRWPVFAVPLGVFVIVSLERPLSPAQPRAAGFTDAVSSDGHRPSQGQGLTPLTSVRRGQRSHLSQEQDGAPGSDGWPDRRGSRMLGVPDVGGPGRPRSVPAPGHMSRNATYIFTFLCFMVAAFFEEMSPFPSLCRYCVSPGGTFDLPPI